VNDKQQSKETLVQTKAQLADEAQSLAKLNELSARLWASHSLREGLDEMLAGAIELMGADKGNIQVLDQRRSILTIEAQRGFEKEFLEFFREVKAEDDTACGRALRSARPTVIEDVDSDAAFAPFRAVARAAGYRAVVSTPLVGSTGLPLGIISTHFVSPHRPADVSLRRIDLYARQAAGFIERCKAEEAFKENEQRFRAIVECSNDPIISKDLNFVITSWNLAAERMFGFTADEAIGHPIRIIIPPERYHEEKEILQRIRNGERIEHFETVRHTKNGSRLDVSITVSPIRDWLGRVIGASKIVRDITQQKQVEQMAREVEVTGRLLLVQDEERRRIARELHDSIGQTLAALNMNISTVRREKRNLSDGAASCTDQSDAMIQQAISEVRTISHLLHPPLLEEVGLPSALKEYVAGFVERSKIQVTLDLPSDLEWLPKDSELCLFRVVQECLTNILRHSGSTVALVRLSQTAEQVELEVADQGGGMSLDTQEKFSAGNGSGVGLRGMRERIRQLGGVLEIQSQGVGTSVRAVLPVRRLRNLAIQNEELHR